MKQGIRKKTIIISILSGVFLFIVFSYDLSMPETGTLLDRCINSMHTYGLFGNVVVIGFALLVYLWLRCLKPKIYVHLPFLTVFAVAFGLLNTASLYLFYRDALPIPSFESISQFLLQAAGYSVIFLLLGSAVCYILAKTGNAADPSECSSLSRFFEKHIKLISMLVILVGWAPWIISYYPASMEWDVYYPIRQYLGEIPPNNQHPWFYACVIGEFYNLGIRLGDKNLGVFLHTVLRAILMATIYTRCIVLQRRSGLPRTICFFTLIFYAFTPVWGAYAKHAFKDTFAAACFCWYILTVIKVVEDVQKNKFATTAAIEHATAGLTACLFRNNMVYAVAPATLVIICYSICRRQKWRFSILMLSGLVAFQGYQYYIFNIAGIREGSIKEALSICLQQTARTVKYHSDTITEQDKAAIIAVLNYDDLANSYDPVISDPVKEPWHGTSEEHKQYLVTWAKMFFQYPKTYIEAFVAQSSGYYTFTPQYTEAQRYGPGSHSNVGMTIFNWVEDSRFDKEFVCSYPETMSGLRGTLDKWAEVWHQIPLLNLTDMKPLYTLAILQLGYLLLRKKAYAELIPVGSSVLMILTCVASPVNDCFRYYAPVAASFPALMILTKKLDEVFDKEGTCSEYSGC